MTPLIFFLICIVLPTTLAQTSPTFWLYTRGNKDVPQQINQNDLGLLRGSNFNFNLPTWIGIHGWKQAYNISAHINNTESNLMGYDRFFNITLLRDIKNSYLESGDVNVIGCDWRVLAKRTYAEARYQMVGVAGEVAKLINMIKDNGYDDRKINLVGFSLGAHATGIAAEGVKGGFRGNILAADPPFLFFDMAEQRGRVNKGDAAYVEVLHTSKLGTSSPLGDVDHYINGGHHQWSCPLNDLMASVMCSHGMAIIAYRDSLRKNIFGTMCSSEKDALMGWCSGGQMVVGGLMPKYWSPGIYHANV